MKRKALALLLVAALLAVALSGCEGGKALGSGSKGLPAVGEVVNGFKVLRLDPVEHLSGTAVHFEHEKTGAQLIYLACDDTNRSFSIAFRTPIDNDKGIPHVFEHSALSGSDKYPDPSLFFSMMERTYNTYLNAFTSTNYTMYPCASLSEDQLYKYLDYDLNGVYHPLVLEDERAMMREAYRYELADADITLNGTVYSEMQGAITEISAAYTSTLKLLYPGSTRSSNVGGEPEVIPTMTQRDLIDFHNTYYHPSNSLTTLYGDMDYARFLGLIDEFISQYDRREITITDNDYTPVTGHLEGRGEFPLAAGSEADTVTAYAYPMTGATAEDAILARIIASYLNMPSSPLEALRRERLPDAITAAQIDSDATEPTIMFLALNVDEAEKEVFADMVDDAMTQIAAEGLNKDDLRSAAKQEIYTYDTLPENDPNLGVYFGSLVSMYWSRYNNSDAYLEDEKVAYKLLELVDDGSYDEIFKKYFADPETSVLTVTVGVPGLLETRNAELAQSLKDMKAAMSEEEIQALVAKTADFNNWTAENAQNSMIDEMIAVDVASLPEEAQSFEAGDSIEDGLRVVTSTVENSSLVSTNLYFDASSVPYEQLHEYQFLVQLLGDVATAEHSREEVSAQLSKLCFDWGTTATAIIKTDGSYEPKLQVYWTALESDNEDSFNIMREVLLSSQFTDAARMRESAMQMTVAARSQISGSPSGFAIDLADALLTESGRYKEQRSGFAYLEFLQRVSAMSDEEILSLGERLEELRGLLLNKNNLIFGCAAGESTIAASTELAHKLADELDDTAHTSVDYGALLPEWPKSLALIIDGNMQYNYLAINTKDTGAEMNGGFLAMNSVIRDILIPKLRFEGGAYGAAASLDRRMVFLSTYRDPNLASSYAFYDELPGILRELTMTQEELDGYISAAYSQLALPVGPLTGAKQAIADKLTGEDTFGDKARFMKELKAFTVEDARAYADIFETLAQDGVSVSVGGASAVNENAGMFEEIITIPAAA